jgi:hypothetical protein
MFYDEINVLVGKTLTEVILDGDDEIIFTVDDGTKYKLYHRLDCCESVYIEDVSGDLTDLVGVPILVAEERSDDEYETKVKAEREIEIIKKKAKQPNYHYFERSETWTFYEFRTIKGSVTIRWYGTSSGYYSEKARFQKVQ